MYMASEIPKIPREALYEMEKSWKEIPGAAYGDAKVKHPWFVEMAKKSSPYHPTRVVFMYPDGSVGLRYMEKNKDGSVTVGI
jgi:hypothetical protein